MLFERPSDVIFQASVEILYAVIIIICRDSDLHITDLVELVPGVLVLAAPEAVPGDISGLGEVLPPHAPGAWPLVTSLGAPGPEMRETITQVGAADTASININLLFSSMRFMKLSNGLYHF